MESEAVRLIQARWRLGSLSPEALVAFAVDALNGDLDSPTLRILAGETASRRDEIEPLFAAALEELGLEPLGVEGARRVVARHWAARIVGGDVSPYEGGKAIWRECCNTAESRGSLDVFRSLASEHEDYRFAQEDAPDRYASEIQHCEDELVRVAQCVLEEREP